MPRMFLEQEWQVVLFHVPTMMGGSGLASRAERDLGLIMK